MEALHRLLQLPLIQIIQSVKNIVTHTVISRKEGKEPTTMNGEDTFHDMENPEQHNLSLLMKVTQSRGKPLPIGCLTEWLVVQLFQKTAGCTPLGVTLINDRDIVVDFEPEVPIIEIAQVMHRLATWKGKSVDVCA